jgi:bifunctional DNA-binding transcriptional regulator/antitoxin component of YhaV-PrlF toxin-antitoxin module
MQDLLEGMFSACHCQDHRQRQTTIPQGVRAALRVSAGDLIAWEVGADGTATVRRVLPLDIEYLRAVEGTLSEWSGSADEEAYRGL